MNRRQWRQRAGWLVEIQGMAQVEEKSLHRRHSDGKQQGTKDYLSKKGEKTLVRYTEDSQKHSEQLPH